MSKGDYVVAGSCYEIAPWSLERLPRLPPLPPAPLPEYVLSEIREHHGTAREISELYECPIDLVLCILKQRRTSRGFKTLDPEYRVAEADRVRETYGPAKPPPLAPSYWHTDPVGWNAELRRQHHEDIAGALVDQTRHQEPYSAINHVVNDPAYSQQWEEGDERLYGYFRLKKKRWGRYRPAALLNRHRRSRKRKNNDGRLAS